MLCITLLFVLKFFSVLFHTGKRERERERERVEHVFVI